ncbi:MAG: DUF4363 family protein [Clostridia bacterium]|nr:DUF4363 family protein [Clostridia bacterium]MBP3378234.1 DUF4363 family protein [Clostridia bacterium]
MKAFAAVCVFFSLMIAVIVGNAIYINRTVDDFIVTLKYAEFPDGTNAPTDLEGIRIKWEKEKNYIQASVSHDKIDKVSELITSLLIYKRHGHRAEYEKTAELLRVAFEELRLLEELSAVNIF